MMSELEKQEIISRVNAMSKEEKELVVSVIPVDICQNRVTAEIERLLTLEKKKLELRNIKIVSKRAEKSVLL